MATKQMTGPEAHVEVAAQDKRRALKTIEQLAGGVDRQRVTLAKKRAALDKVIALAVSAKPSQPDWHQHPGPLPAAQVREAAGLSTMALHRTLERYRKRVSK